MFVILFATLILDLTNYFIVNYKYIKSDEPALFLVILHASISFYFIFFPVSLLFIFVFKLIPSVRPSLTNSKWFLTLSKIVPNLFGSILLSLLFIIMTLCFCFGFLNHIFNDNMDVIIMSNFFLFSLYWLMFLYHSVLTYLILLPERQGNTLVV